MLCSCEHTVEPRGWVWYPESRSNTNSDNGDAQKPEPGAWLRVQYVRFSLCCDFSHPHWTVTICPALQMGRRQGIFQGLALGGINAIVYYT